MRKLIILIVVFYLLGILVIAAIPESNEMLVRICYENVHKPFYRQTHGITDPDWGAWCREKYPLY